MPLQHPFTPHPLQCIRLRRWFIQRPCALPRLYTRQRPLSIWDSARAGTGRIVAGGVIAEPGATVGIGDIEAVGLIEAVGTVSRC